MSTTYSPEGGIFTAEEIQCLEEDTIFLPPALGSQTHGKRKVSASLVSSLSSPSIISSLSSSSASIRTRNFEPSTISTDIPTNEESAEVLEYIGFEPSTAQQIYERYVNRLDPDSCPDDLLDYAYGQIAVLQTDPYANMDIQQAMGRVGLTLQIQSAIADPDFSDILWTRDLHFWVKDTIQTNYATLCGRQELLKRHAGRRIAHKSKPQQRTSVQGHFPSEGEPVPGAAGSDVTATINITFEDFRLPLAHVSVSEGDVPARPDHFALYKGKAYWDMTGSQQLIRPDGSVDLSTLVTSSRGDFNPTFDAHYWSPERDTAERYRLWAASRSPGSDTCIIQIQLSNTFVQPLHSGEIWFSPDWKEYVWVCKQGQRPPSKFDYLRDAEVVKGHICTGVSRRISRIAESEVQTQIMQDQLLLHPSTHRPAKQWMFWKPEVLDRLENEIRGKMHIDIFAAGITTAP